ncbi:DNA polymerase I [Bifidobacterium tibiigranuli]|jgi:DNA polymerase-1|uniref:DNA polymerase I n=1 Tax=Bifidobacterium tibiigranuli TaxID=2172043 RepID=UPI002352220A|nr:DNA polymerase I [Bifidobacterium tibiigranuli]MCH3974712.1 DNA polymerase I [Bifidobacterium tibiigranuli]MCH4188960.1 DNA polymerase I [Bifidobacterium tibiigranuli]MCH4203680.1 DNA polymerase I [Bifidobacterium tibiigranuli]MCH4274113.1 DNA polymerase I [Bifidobacterium tibiigranuli]MCI1210647.1 DNA polymerase I [Bifidobacterium tibiigranuli]
MSEEQGPEETLLVVDGHSLAFRAYFALPVENFSTSAGQATNAVWGFATMLAQVIEAEKPNHLAVAFDVAGGTFRNTMLPQYKGTRDAAPEELLSQLPLIQDMLTALGVTYIEMPGYEGDDVIGTLATMGEDRGYRTLVLSGDRDAFQLVDDAITVLYPGHHFKDLKHMTPDAIEEKYRVTPQQYPDLAALRGETADNIPGVPGVGDGYAAKWISQFGSLEGIIDHAEDISGKKGESLRANLDQVRLNRKVNALVRDLDLGVKIEDCTFGQVDAPRLDKLFTQLEFGARTKQRVLKTFGTVGTLDAAASSAIEEDAPQALVQPQTERIEHAEALQLWVQQYLPAAADDAQQHDEAAAQQEAQDQQPQTPTGALDSAANAAPAESAEDFQHIVDGTAQCGPGMAATWVLHALGSPKPGHASLDMVVLLAGDHAAVLPGDMDGELHDAIQTLLNERHGSLVVHGYKEHKHILGAAGLKLGAPYFDTKLAGYLVHPDFHADSLEQAAEHFLDIRVETSDAVTQGQLDLDDDQPEHGEFDSAVEQSAIVRLLADTLAPQLDERRQFGLLHSIEMPVSDVLHGMERTGAYVNVQRLVDMRDQFSAEASQAQEIAWHAAGTEVNLQSPKQLQKVLFDDMGLKPTRRTKSGSYTTNASSLQDLYVKSVNNEQANAFLGALLRHRETNKLKQIVQTLIDASNKRDMRVHTTFEQTVAATGRLSSVDPNLQNIPNRNAAGREIRSAFVPGEGYESLLSCDYSQVELRIMADLSGDEALIEAFRSGTDFHKYVASLVYDLPVADISSDQRSHVKAMSYGLAYGLSTYGLAHQLKISPAAADVLKEKYFATFGKVHDYLESLVQTAKRKGYTETIFGRRRYFPALKSTSRVARDAAERGALNAPIQGSAADIMKLAMIRAERLLREAGAASRIILQIHDELVIEVAPGEAEQVSELVRDAMEHAVNLAVPLDVSIGIGADWQLAAH